MTTIAETQVICGVCKTESTQRELASTNRFGSPDLDLRPPEMARSTMSYWLQRCPSCSYLAARLDEAEPEAARVVQSREYKSVLEDNPAPQLARHFHCRAIIESALGRKRRAFTNLLAAAWVADDAGLNDLAHDYRFAAANHVKDEPEREVELTLQLVDVLRRAAAFDEANELIESLPGSVSDERLLQIRDVQRILCSHRDTDGYSISQALAMAAD